MRLTAEARGVYPIAPTPFFADGAIDNGSIDRLTDFHLACGSTGITVLGQLGEAPKLEHAESVAVATRIIRRAVALPVIVGVSAPGFAAMRTLAHAVMIVGYCRQAVDAIGAEVPFAVQDYPLTFTVQMSPGVIRRIVADLPSCVMPKHDDWPGLERIATLRGCESDGSMRHIAILTANNGLFLDCKMEPGVGLAVRKYVRMRRGLLTSDAQRRPAAAMSSRTRDEVEHRLGRLAAHDARAALPAATP